MTTKTSAGIIEDEKNIVGILHKSMSRAEESVKASRDRAEVMLRLLEELLGRAEELSQKSKDTAEAAIRMSQEVVNRISEICQATEEEAKKAKEALEDSIDIAQTRSDSVMNTAWLLSRAAKAAMEAPEKEAKAEWWNG